MFVPLAIIRRRYFGLFGFGMRLLGLLGEGATATSPQRLTDTAPSAPILVLGFEFWPKLKVADTFEFEFGPKLKKHNVNFEFEF